MTIGCEIAASKNCILIIPKPLEVPARPLLRSTADRILARRKNLQFNPLPFTESTQTPSDGACVECYGLSPQLFGNQNKKLLAQFCHVLKPGIIRGKFFATGGHDLYSDAHFLSEAFLHLTDCVGLFDCQIGHLCSLGGN